MPQIEIRKEQVERLAALEEALDAHAGPYASVTTVDAVEYLLDLAAEVGDRPDGADGAVVETAASLAEQEGSLTDDEPAGTELGEDEPGATSTDTEAEGGSSEEPSTDANGDTGDSADGNGDTASTDDRGDVFDLLREHDEKWRKSGGDEPYEVDLPDGGTERVRTRGDVKAILFKNYR